jgi:hypothetical protein
MVAREVDRDRLVRAPLARRESYKRRRREEKSATWATIDRI